MTKIITVVANTKAQAYRALNNMAGDTKPNILFGRPQKQFRYSSNVKTEFAPGCQCDSGKTEFRAKREDGKNCYVLFAEFP
ncbi:MAG: hypothetical protein COA69_08985 [Robiginitomaculum sp.]|nr:MAG: hypothetical protein COA69_08985 [Robiginitomaculum sp.]